MPSNLKPVLYRYYGFSAGIQILFWLPIFYAYQKLMGLSDAQYFAIQSYYYWIFCFLELPTGWIADRIGYKNTLVAASLTMAISNISAVFWTSSLGFFFHFVLIATARSLTSGSANAYLFEYLQENGTPDLYKQVEGRARSISLICRVAAWGAAGFLFNYHATIPYWLTFASCLLAALAAAGLPKLKGEMIKKTKTATKVIFQEIAFNRVLLYSIIVGAGVFVLTRISLINLYQPLMQAKGFSAAAFGLVMSLLTVFEAVGADQAHRIQKSLSDHRAIFLSTVAVALSLAGVVFSAQIMTIVCFSLFSFFTGVAFPLSRQQVNAAIKDGQYRATLLSVESIFHRIFMGSAAMIGVYFVKHDRMNDFILYACAFVAIAVGLATYLLKRAFRSQELQTN